MWGPARGRAARGGEVEVEVDVEVDVDVEVEVELWRGWAGESWWWGEG